MIILKGWVLPCLELEEPEKGFQLVRYHTEEAHESSIFLGCASMAPSAGWHVASRGNLSPLTQTHKRLYFMAVCVGFEPTERYSRSRFSKPAHLPLCQHTSWQELKDLNPYKMIWNHLCYRYTKSLEMAGAVGIEPTTHGLTVRRY